MPKAAKYVKLTTRVIGNGSTFTQAAGAGYNSAKNVYHNAKEGKFFTVQNLLDVASVGLSAFTIVCSGKQTLQLGEELAGMLRQDVPAVFSKAKKAASSAWEFVKYNNRDFIPYDRQGYIGSGSGADDIVQYEKLKSEYMADEVYNADRIGSGLKEDPSHRAASYLSKEQLANGRTYGYRGGDGDYYKLLQVKGQMDGQDGIFEYIVNNSGQVTHQRFISGGKYTGFPNQHVPKGGY